jgi:hypothetical protein
VHDLFAFFAQAVHDNQPAVHGQYEAAVAAVPGNDPAYLAVLRSVLLLKAAHVPPTTALLAFCLFDAAPEDAQASRLHDTLEFCDRAGALWRNEATGIWDFGRTAGPSVTDAIESEMAMIPRAESAYLIRTVAELQAEVAEYLGEFDIEPGPSGVVRRVRAEILDLRKGLAVAPVVNPALSDPQRTWCSACISVVVAETDELLAQWRRWVAELRPAPCYYLVPAEPVVITGDARRLWATIRLLKRGGWDDLTAAALDGQVVALRRSLANEFAAYFGSEGLRAGRCTIMRAGARTPIAAVSSWQELLLRVSEDASASYGREVRVRCGTYNEWITSGRANPISKVVAAVLSPSSASPAVSRYLGFAETSQEAAVVDGVLADNALLVPTVDGTWALRQFDGSSAEPAAEVLRVIQDHLARTGGEKQFSRLFTTLIEPPYGIPNGIIPILVACALRDQIDRIAFYERKGKGLQRVSRDDVANALVQMALRPGDYSSRYEALSGKNRVVLRAVGEAINVHFSTVQCGGDAFYDRCHDVRTELVAWARGLLDGAVATAPLNEAQRRLLRCLRNPVPPQYSELAEGLIAVFADNPACTAEIAADSAAGSGFGAIRARWSELRATLARAAEDIETPLRDVIERVTEGGAVSLKQVVSPLSFGGSPGALTPLDEAAGTPDRGAAEFVVRLSGKAAGKVGPEDYGFARGVLEAAERIRPNRDEMRVVASDRTVNLARVADQSGDSVVERHIHAIQLETGLDLPAIASLVLQRLLSSQMERPNHDEGDVRGASPEEA